MVMPGDLVKVRRKNKWKRNLLTDRMFNDETWNMFSEVEFGNEAVGLVIEERFQLQHSFVKILTHEGAGWLQSDLLVAL